MQGPGDTAGRATAVVVITPARRWWAAWLRFDFAAIALLRALLRQVEPSKPVRRLSFISFAHWAVVDRMPPAGGGAARRLPHPYILFQSNFNGAAAEYVEAFARGLKWRMRGLWGGAYGVPDPTRVVDFTQYIEAHWIPCGHYYAAYPPASTKMILSALQIRSRHDEFAARVPEIDPDRFRDEFEQFVAHVQEQSRPRPGGLRALRRARPKAPGAGADGLCVLTPVAEGHEDRLQARLYSLPSGARSPMIRVRGTHYARWAVLHLEGRDGKPLPSEPAYLLFCSEFDGELEPYVRRLCTELGDDAHEIWSLCAGYPGRDDAALAAYLLDHRVAPGYSVVAYPGFSVDEVRAAFALRERLNDFLVRTATLDSPALKHAWSARFRSGVR